MAGCVRSASIRRFELGDELMPALGRQVEFEEFDGDESLARRVVRTKHRTQRAGTDLMKNAKRTERPWMRSAGSFRVQREDSSGRRWIVTLKHFRFNRLAVLQ